MGRFILDTDASDLADGTVMSQEQGGQEVVISYMSKALNKHEKSYCTTRKELLMHFQGSLVKPVITSRHLTRNHKIVIRTRILAINNSTWARCILCQPLQGIKLSSWENRNSTIISIFLMAGSRRISLKHRWRILKSRQIWFLRETLRLALNRIKYPAGLLL